MKKILALSLALVMVLALCACGGAKTEEPAPAAPAAEAAPAAPAAEAAPAAPAAEGDDFAQWKEYLKVYAAAGAPSEEAGQSLMVAIDAAATAEDVDAIQQMDVMFSTVGVLHYDEWVAAGKPAADTSSMGDPTAAVSGEPSGEPAA